MQASWNVVSLETPVGEDRDAVLADFLCDERDETALDVASSHDLREAIDEALSALRDREAQVLALLFGIDDDRQRTLAEVAMMLHMTRERVRQIEVTAIRKLRRTSRGKDLRDFLGA